MLGQNRAPKPSTIGLFCVVVALGCSSEEELKKADPPVARLEVSPGEGTLGQTFRYDAAASSVFAAGGLTYRFKTAESANWTDFGTTAWFEAKITEAGSFQASVEVKDSTGQTSVARTGYVVRANVPPTIALSLTPVSGPPPLFVLADFTGSSDPDAPGEPLATRVDFDGDGTFDQVGTTAVQLAFTYANIGTYTVHAEVEDAAGAIATREVQVEVGYFADLDVDANRDGVIGDDDEALEETFGTAGGAVLLANLDDDDLDGRADVQDASSPANDEKDLTPMIVRRLPEIGTNDLLSITVAPPNVRIFEEVGGQMVERLAPGGSALSLDPRDLALADLPLFLEASVPRGTSFDGKIRMTLEYRPSSGPTITDTVQLRVAPILFPSNLQHAKRLYVMPISGDITENSDALTVIRRNMPAGVELFEVDENAYGGDRWVQDCMQTGYQSAPREDGPQVMQTYLNTVRGQGRGDLRDFIPTDMFGANLGFVDPGGRESSHNYGGNIEVTAPYENGTMTWPFGRMLVGGGDQGSILGVPRSDRPTRQERALLDTQMQGPALELSSEWLYVGHIDEIFMLVPAPNRAGDRKWKIVFASPELAIQDMEALQQQGQGAATVFSELQFPQYDRFGGIAGWRDATTPAADLLADTELMTYNRGVQARIDSIREVLTQEMNLTDDDIVEVPVLYEIDGYDGTAEMGAAMNPGVQNLQVVNDVLFVPDPEGPRVQGADHWQALTRQALEPLGVAVHFVDVWYSYHILVGEIHCGTEIEHEPFSTQWWEVESR